MKEGYFEADYAFWAGEKVYSVSTLVAIGILITLAIVATEILLIRAEVNMAPTAAVVPVVGIPLEIVLISASVFLIDFEIAYWAYVYNVSNNPFVEQRLDLLPPWGLDD